MKKQQAPKIPVSDNYTDRISLAKCKEMMNAQKHGWTDQQVLSIRNFLYKLAAIDYKITMRSFQSEDLAKEDFLSSEVKEKPLNEESNESKEYDKTKHKEQQTEIIKLRSKQFRKAS